MKMNPAGASYGFVDDVSSSIQQVVEKLTATLGQVVDNLTTVEVRTCTSPSMDSHGRTAVENLRAYTRTNIGGETMMCLPEIEGKLDDALWKIHSQMVDRAVANRLELLKLAAEAISGLATASKPK